MQAGVIPDEIGSYDSLPQRGRTGILCGSICGLLGSGLGYD